MSAISIPLFLLASSLAPVGAGGLPGARAAKSGRRAPLGGWAYAGADERRDDVIAALSKRAIVLLGESHDEAEHHRWQLHTIAALFSRHADMVLAFEMFPRRVQPVLDRWSKGELDEAAFLSEVDWRQVWGFPSEFYLPLFHFARMHRLPMLALNVDRVTTRRIGAQGFAATSSSEREEVGEPTAASASYRARLFEWFKKHPAAGQEPRADSEPFERFVRAQLFWDRAMAEPIARARRAGRLIVGFMGSGHVEFGEGVPHQLAALGVHDVATALPWRADVDIPNHDRPIADLLFGVA